MWNTMTFLHVLCVFFIVQKRTWKERFRYSPCKRAWSLTEISSAKLGSVLCFITPRALWVKELNLLGKVLASSCMVSMHPARLHILEAVPTHSPLERHQRNTARVNCITISGRGAISGAARRGALNGCLSASDRFLTVSPALLLEYLFKYLDQTTAWSWLNTAKHLLALNLLLVFSFELEKKTAFARYNPDIYEKTRNISGEVT